MFEKDFERVTDENGFFRIRCRLCKEIIQAGDAGAKAGFEEILGGFARFLSASSFLLHAATCPKKVPKEPR